jgi:hypothetical protein
MQHLPPDLPRLRTLETWLALTLDEVRHAITAAEQREAERQHATDHRPPPPEWLLEQGLNRDTPAVYVHTGDCWNASKRSRGVDRATAMRALAEGVTACPQCRPDNALGFLD